MGTFYPDNEVVVESTRKNRVAGRSNVSHSSYLEGTSSKPSDSSTLAKINPATYKLKEAKKFFAQL